MEEPKIVTRFPVKFWTGFLLIPCRYPPSQILVLTHTDFWTNLCFFRTLCVNVAFSAFQRQNDANLVNALRKTGFPIWKSFFRPYLGYVWRKISSAAATVIDSWDFYSENIRPVLFLIWSMKLGMFVFNSQNSVRL